jgi:hypothetical protein
MGEPTELGDTPRRHSLWVICCMDDAEMVAKVSYETF